MAAETRDDLGDGMSAAELSAADYRKLVFDSPESTIVLDGDGTVVMASRRALDMFGYADGELPGVRIDALLDADAARPLTDDPANVLWQLDARHRDGRVFPVRMRAQRIDRSRHLLVVVLRDSLAPDGTGDDVAVRAPRAQEPLDGKANGRLLATASHDLRQPLQTLRLLNQSLAEQVDGPALRELVDHQARAIGRMGDLLNALLDISKIESGMVAPQISDIDLGALATALDAEFAPLAAARGLSFSVAGAAPVRSDPVLLGQILRNLLGNALKFTERGGVTLTAEPDGQRVRVTVSDTGIGIPADHIPRLFDEFYRVPCTDGRSVDGFGLGLSIVRRLADLIGARITIDSQPGQGTRVVVDLPAGTLAQDAAPRQVLRNRSRLVAGPRRVLLVEDDAGLRYATRRWLSGRGLEIEAVASGRAALDAVAQGFVPDLVVADLHLTNGETALTVIDGVRDALHRAVPALVLTGDTSAAADAAARRAGIGLLLKPVDPEELLDRIRALLG